MKNDQGNSSNTSPTKEDTRSTLKRRAEESYGDQEQVDKASPPPKKQETAISTPATQTAESLEEMSVSSQSSIQGRVLFSEKASKEQVAPSDTPETNVEASSNKEDDSKHSVYDYTHLELGAKIMKMQKSGKKILAELNAKKIDFNTLQTDRRRMGEEINALESQLNESMVEKNELRSDLNEAIKEKIEIRSENNALREQLEFMRKERDASAMLVKVIIDDSNYTGDLEDLKKHKDFSKLQAIAMKTLDVNPRAEQVEVIQHMKEYYARPANAAAELPNSQTRPTGYGDRKDSDEQENIR